MRDDDLDFSAEEFHAMSNGERIQLCRKLAARSRELAKLSDPGRRAPYQKIAQEWDALADEMERVD